MGWANTPTPRSVLQFGNSYATISSRWIGNIYRRSDWGSCCWRSYLCLDDWVRYGCRVAIVSKHKSNINAEAEVLLDVAGHVGTCITSNSRLVTYCGIVMTTYWQVNVWQAYYVPFMEVCSCTAQSLTVYTG